MKQSAPTVLLDGEYALVQTGDNSGYVDVKTPSGGFRVLAEKRSSWEALQNALRRHPLPRIKAYVSVENGVQVLRYVGWKRHQPTMSLSASVEGTYIGLGQEPSWPGHFVIEIGYSNKSSKTKRDYDGVIRVHLPEELRDQLPEVGQPIRITGTPHQWGEAVRITAEGEQLPWPDVRIVGDMIHVAQSWVRPGAAMSMVPAPDRIYCGRCERWLEPEDFRPNQKTGRRTPPCRACRRAYQRSYDSRNREKKRERDRGYAARPEVKRRRNERRRNKERRDRYPVIWFGGIRFQAHRLEVLRHRGRLADHEIVHHVDGDPRNYSIENLWVFDSQSDHKRHEMGGTVPPTWRGDHCPCPVCSVDRELRESA